MKKLASKKTLWLIGEHVEMRKSELFIRAGRDKGKRQKGFFYSFRKVSN
jgi:hypothetical protein